MKFARPINTGGNEASISTPYSNAHTGIDYAYPVGTKIYASESGKVVFAKGNESRQWIANTPSDPFRINVVRALTTADYGNFIKIDHGAGYSSLYAHLKYDSLYVKVGDTVSKGQLIAEVGSTGNSTGNHTHWETRLNDQTFDPSTMFDSEFSRYKDGADPATPAGQVAVDANVFPVIIHGSTQWDKSVEKYVPGRDPKDANFEDLQNVVNGIQSRSTDLSNQLATANQRAENKEEEISRLNLQVSGLQAIEKRLTTQLKEASKIPNDTMRVYQEQLKSKQAELDKYANEKGKVLKENALLKTKLENCQKSTTTPITPSKNPVSDIIAWLNKLGGKK